MKYHDITHDDMRNGDGLRVVLWVAGCEHHCKGCHNPVTWDSKDGKELYTTEIVEIFQELNKPYVSGLTFSGGDPLHPENRTEVCHLCKYFKTQFPDKTIWLYTGYTWEEIIKPGFVHYPLLTYIDVLVDGRFEEELKDINYPWAGSTNQRVIDVQRTLKEGRIILHESN